MKKFSYVSPKNIVITIVFMLFLLSFPTMLIIVGNAILEPIVFFVIPVLILACIFFYPSIFIKVHVHNEGVTYSTPFKKYEMKWIDIYTIGIGELKIRYSSALFIYFSKENRYYSHLGSRKISDDFITVGFRKSIIKELRKYWDYRIEGLSELGLDDGNKRVKVNQKK